MLQAISSGLRPAVAVATRTAEAKRKRIVVMVGRVVG